MKHGVNRISTIFAIRDH